MLGRIFEIDTEN